MATLARASAAPAGPRVAILTNAGGPGILAADACEAHGLQLPALAEERRASCAHSCRRRPGSITRWTCSRPLARTTTTARAGAPRRSRRRQRPRDLHSAAGDRGSRCRARPCSARRPDSTKPVLATFMGVEGAIPLLAPIPCYRFPESAIAALARAVDTVRGAGRRRGACRPRPAGLAQAR